jgi:hypothetical protein
MGRRGRGMDIEICTVPKAVQKIANAEDCSIQLGDYFQSLRIFKLLQSLGNISENFTEFF